MRKLIDAGRLELKGAAARFKSRGTLEAFDRNLGDLGKIRARMTPAPDLKLFVDVEFPGDVFRVWQESTVVNYRDFLDKVEFSGIDNFRALIRHLTTAVGETGHDAATREFAEKKAPPERFVSADELAAYDAAITGAKVPASAAALPVAPSATELEKKRAAEIAWKKFAVEAAVEKRDPPNTALLGGLVLAAFGALMMVVSVLALAQSRGLPEDAPNVYPIIAVGLALGLTSVIAGVLFMRRKPRG